MQHLITLLNADDAITVCNAAQEEFGQYKVSVRKIEISPIIDEPEYKVEAEYSGRKRLTIVEANIAAVLLPKFARAFYLGMLSQRQGSGQCTRC